MAVTSIAFALRLMVGFAATAAAGASFAAPVGPDEALGADLRGAPAPLWSASAGFGARSVAGPFGTAGLGAPEDAGASVWSRPGASPCRLPDGSNPCFEGAGVFAAATAAMGSNGFAAAAFRHAFDTGALTPSAICDGDVISNSGARNGRAFYVPRQAVAFSRDWLEARGVDHWIAPDGRACIPTLSHRDWHYADVCGNAIQLIVDGAPANGAEDAAPRRPVAPAGVFTRSAAAGGAGGGGGGVGGGGVGAGAGGLGAGASNGALIPVDSEAASIAAAVATALATSADPAAPANAPTATSGAAPPRTAPPRTAAPSTAALIAPADDAATAPDPASLIRDAASSGQPAPPQIPAPPAILALLTAVGFLTLARRRRPAPQGKD